MDTKEKPVEGKIPKPAKGWRNKYRALNRYQGRPTMTWRNPGDIFYGSYTWPSKDVAETQSTDLDNVSQSGNAEYLGAFSEGWE